MEDAENFKVDPELLLNTVEENAEPAQKKVAPKKKPRKKTNNKRKGTTPQRLGKAGLKRVGSKAGKRTTKAGGVRKPHRWRPGTVALRDIRRLQKTTENQFRKAPFQRLVREVTQHVTDDDMRFQAKALEALQCIAEDAVHEMLSTAYAGSTIMDGRVTLLPKDIRVWAKMTKGSLGEAARQALGLTLM